MFNIDTLRAERHHEPFEFVLDGETVSLPHVQTLPADLALRLDGGELLDALPDAAGPELAARLLAQPVFVLEELIQAWLAHAGVTQGESPASTDS